jgi:hypothetical protein
MADIELNRETSGPRRRAAENFAWRKKIKSILLREAEFEQPDSAKPASRPALQCFPELLARARQSAATAACREGYGFFISDQQATGWLSFQIRQAARATTLLLAKTIQTGRKKKADCFFLPTSCWFFVLPLETTDGSHWHDSCSACDRLHSGGGPNVNSRIRVMINADKGRREPAAIIGWERASLARK